MRKAMKNCIQRLLLEHQQIEVLLIDIGAYFYRDLIREYPDQIKNIGIFESGTISIAAGLSMAGITPVVYGISPFIAERALEQLKLDFVYQNLGGNFITTGASYDFSKLGYSHYCCEDAAILKTLPGMEIITPGNPDEFEVLFHTCCFNGKATYLRMTDYPNKNGQHVEYGKAAVIRTGQMGTVIVFAEMLDRVLQACADLDVTILYYTTAEPFDAAALRSLAKNEKICVCSPFYTGTFTDDIVRAMDGVPVQIKDFSVPRQILRSYGTKEEKDDALGLSAEALKQKMDKFFRD